MNRALVRRAAAGLAAWLHERHPDRIDSGVVVGFDARHKSADFAEDTCRVLAGAGIPSHLLPGPLPTPVLAFGVRHLDAAAGVMVTASHNPPMDNGYKVYDWSRRADRAADRRRDLGRDRRGRTAGRRAARRARRTARPPHRT